MLLQRAFGQVLRERVGVGPGRDQLLRVLEHLALGDLPQPLNHLVWVLRVLVNSLVNVPPNKD